MIQCVAGMRCTYKTPEYAEDCLTQASYPQCERAGRRDVDIDLLVNSPHRAPPRRAGKREVKHTGFSPSLANALYIIYASMVTI